MKNNKSVRAFDGFFDSLKGKICVALCGKASNKCHRSESELEVFERLHVKFGAFSSKR